MELEEDLSNTMPVEIVFPKYPKGGALFMHE